MTGKLVRLSVIVALLFCTSIWAVPSSKGTPLGGMGTGYIVFNAQDGNFAAVTKVSPSASLTGSEFNSWKSNSCGFHLYANGTGKQKATTTTEDAKIPIYAADFGSVGGVSFIDTSFGPFISGAAYEQLAHSPLAFFDISAKNNNTTACTVAVALEFSNTSGTNNLLGGANTGTADGANAITWAGDTTAGNGYMTVNCDDAGAKYASGAIGTFLTNGTVTQGAGNITSAKCYLAAGATIHFKFVIGWWSPWTYSATSTSKPGSEGRWYYNFYANSKEAVAYGVANFNKVRAGAISIVKRTMASNFPEWYKERLLCNLYPQIHNSVSAKDGRTGFWEGQYAIIGTIDQGEHAALWYIFNWPGNQWRELQYWARQSRQEATLLGQIHHDFNGTTSTSTWTYANTDINHFLYPWDNYTHLDYAWQSNTTDWADLNSMFIYKAYELMMATGDKDSLRIYWPYIKRAANRIIVQSGTNKIPTTAKCTYDDGQADANYCCGEALTSWLAVIEMAKWMGEDSTVQKYTAQYNAGRLQYDTGFVAKSTYGTGSNKVISDDAGYDWAHYLNLPAIIDSARIATVTTRTYTYSAALSGVNRLGKWHFYGYDHFGGTCIAIGRPDTAMTVHKWDYDQFYGTTTALTHVFWQDLWGTNTSYYSYMTAPGVWRSYFQMTGTMLDNANHRLWIRPMIPSSMNKTLTNASIINPKGWGLLNYTDSIVSTRTQSMTVSFDSLTTISQVVLKNNTYPVVPQVAVSNNNTSIAATAITVTVDSSFGSAFERLIRVTFTSPIQVGTGGLQIQVYKGAAPNGIINAVSVTNKADVMSITGNRIAAGKSIQYSTAKSGHVTMELISPNGARIGKIMSQDVSAGAHTFVWNGKASSGTPVSAGVVLLRLSSESGTISKAVFVGK